MTTTPEDNLTRDLAALQRLPEDEQPPGVLEPTCATTGVTAHGISRPALGHSRPADEVAADTDDPQADS